MCKDYHMRTIHHRSLLNITQRSYSVFWLTNICHFHVYSLKKQDKCSPLGGECLRLLQNVNSDASTGSKKTRKCSYWRQEMPVSGSNGKKILKDARKKKDRLTRPLVQEDLWVAMDQASVKNKIRLFYERAGSYKKPLKNLPAPWAIHKKGSEYRNNN